MPRKKKLDEPAVEPAVPTEIAPESTPTEPKPKTTRRRAPKAEAAPEPASEPAPEPEKPKRRTRAKAVPPEPEPVRKTRRAQSVKPQPDLEPAAAAATGVEDEVGWVVTFRARTEVVASEPTAEAASLEKDEEEESKGRRRRRRGRGSRDEEKAEAVTVEAEGSADEPEPEPEAEPKVTVRPPEHVSVMPPKRQTLPVPADAPQVIVRNGQATLVREGRIYPPLFFFGGATEERSAANVFEELRLAAEAGVHLHQLLVPFPVSREEIEATLGFAAYLVRRAVEADPEAQILLRLNFSAVRGWTDRYPDARYRTLDGSPAEPSVCDDRFWGDAASLLERFVKSIRLLPEAKHLLGVHLDRGEWFLPEGNGYDNSRAAEQKFQDWCRTRYHGDEVSLRASWFDGSARFDTISVPTYEAELGEGDRFVRSSRRQRRVVDYHLFLSDATVTRIAELARTVKEASDGYLVVGCSYGYTFEWLHPASGHLALGKLLRTPEVDLIAGPPSYRDRQPGGAAPFPGPIDSYVLNGKLYLSEADYKTSLGATDYDSFNPVLKTPQALESVHWRDAGVALAHGTGMVWMDTFGQGWLKTHSVWERAEGVLKVLTERLDTPLGDPEVAIFIDERSLAYLVDPNAFSLLVQNVRDSVLRAGVSAAFYLLSDLAHREKFPDSKLYLFLNAWDIRPDLRAAIKSRLQCDGKVLFWLYSAGLFDGGRDSLERAREVTGIALKPQPFSSKTGTTLVNRRNPLTEAFEEREIVSESQLEPSYFAIPEEGVVLGEYTQSGLPSFVMKEFREGSRTAWTSVFLGEPVVNTALIRGLAHLAGVHVWDFAEDVVHVRRPFLTLHADGAGMRTVALPEKSAVYDLTARQFVAQSGGNVRFNCLEGSTHTFLYGSRADVEHLLDTDPEKVLRIGELPPRDLNVRDDASQFDVPIMRLDEWMSSSEDDDVSDEWFLRPLPALEESAKPEVATADEPGRRRRRRGRGEDREPRPAPEREQSTSGDDLDIGVMFRRRS